MGKSGSGGDVVFKQGDRQGGGKVQRRTLPLPLRQEVASFDAIVGNPPYNLEAREENGFMPTIYHLVISRALEHLAEGGKAAFIFPGRGFFGNGSVDVQAWAKEQMGHMDLVSLYRDTKPIFGFGISGGVCIGRWFGRSDFWDFRPAQMKAIADKVASADSLGDHFNPICHLWNERRRKGERGMESNVFDARPELFSDEPVEGWIKVRGRQACKRTWKWIDPALVIDPNLSYWRTLIAQANSWREGAKLSTPEVLAPGETCTYTFHTIGQFKTREEAENCRKYVETKFARLLLSVFKVTQTNNSRIWRLVPWQDFSPTSDIDWSEDREGLDRQLYAKYGLTKEEADWIERKMR